MPEQTILLAGGTGFVGRAVFKQLLKIPDKRIHLLIRENSLYKIADLFNMPEEQKSRIKVIIGSAESLSECEFAAEGCGAIINTIGIIREFPSRNITFENIHINVVKNLTCAGKSAGIKKILHISALGANPESGIKYFKTKWLGEEIVKNSGIDYVILRPSIVFGQEDKFINMLKAFMFPFLPFFIPGNGKTLFQPISVDNLAEAAVKTLIDTKIKNTIYEAAGEDILTFEDIINLIAKSKKIKHFLPIRIPVSLIAPIVKLMERFKFFPITTDQLKMLQINNVSDNKFFLSRLEIKPIKLIEMILER